ncbi:hypothetical protein, partial [Flavobacterium sp. Root420]|uniref:hypothetical protein n=1 Tax=Flavobacterium sp. Root420 TaxID=1736533 RepID=UPI0019D6ECAD
ENLVSQPFGLACKNSIQSCKAGYSLEMCPDGRLKSLVFLNREIPLLSLTQISDRFSGNNQM